MQTALIVALVLGFAFWFYKTKLAVKNNKKIAPNTRNLTTNPEKLDGKYRCAEIKPGLVYCKAVEALKKKVYLLGEVPQIPLNNCEMRTACKCKYLRFNDRRREDRRENILKANAIAQGLAVEGKDEKRGRRGRRATD